MLHKANVIRWHHINGKYIKMHSHDLLCSTVAHCHPKKVQRSPVCIHPDTHIQLCVGVKRCSGVSAKTVAFFCT